MGTKFKFCTLGNSTQASQAYSIVTLQSTFRKKIVKNWRRFKNIFYYKLQLTILVLIDFFSFLNYLFQYMTKAMELVIEQSLIMYAQITHIYYIRR